MSLRLTVMTDVVAIEETGRSSASATSADDVKGNTILNEYLG